MTEKDFDSKETVIISEIKKSFQDIGDKEFHAISIFCTMFKDEFCEKDD